MRDEMSVKFPTAALAVIDFDCGHLAMISNAQAPVRLPPSFALATSPTTRRRAPAGLDRPPQRCKSGTLKQDEFGSRRTACAQSAAGVGQLGEADMGDYYDLGGHSYPVTTDLERGADLVRSRPVVDLRLQSRGGDQPAFEKALEADPGCAMAHWGVGYATGPNYNMPWHKSWTTQDPRQGAQDRPGHAAANAAFAREYRRGHRLGGRSHPRPRLARYPEARAGRRHADRGTHDFCRHHARLPSTTHPDVPGGAHHLRRGDPQPDAVEDVGPESGTPAERCADAGGAAGARGGHGGPIRRHAPSGHPAPLRSPDGDVAVPGEGAQAQGDALRTLVPDSGHLIHMPTHIDVLCGYYRDVLVHWNQEAVRAGP